MPEPESDLKSRVLLLEDDDTIAKIVRARLTAEGLDVERAANVPDGKKLIEERQYHVVLIDNRLPGGTGLDVVRLVAGKCPNTRAIIITAHASVENAVEALRLGATDYLEKPIDLDLLTAKVRHGVDAARACYERDALLAQYEALVDLIPGIVFFHTEQGSFRVVNSEGARILGYNSDELVGKHYRAILGDDDVERDRWVFEERRWGERRTHRRIVELVAKDGSKRVFEMSSTAGNEVGRAGGRVKGTLGVGWDVTEQAALMEQLRQSQKMEAVGRLAGGIAHDFNNMLTVIKANTMSLLQAAPEELREELMEMGVAVEQASELTRQLLTFTGRRVSAPATFDVNHVLGRIVPMLQRLLGELIEIKLELDERPVIVRATKGQLEQVIVNLAVNARDAMPDGGVLTLTTDITDIDAGQLRKTAGLAPGTYARIRVKDTGHGMSEEVLEHVFEPFFTTKSQDRGSGLGLSIVYGIVQHHNGFIDIKSRVGEGTTVDVLFSFAEHDAFVPDEAMPASQKLAPVGPLALVVEDQPLVRRVVRRTLEREGFRVVEAEDGVEGLEMVQAHKRELDVLVTDVVMPRMGGAELARRARDVLPDLCVLYMSGYVGEPRVERDLLETLARFVEKPVTAGRLVENIQELLLTRELHRGRRGGAA